MKATEIRDCQLHECQTGIWYLGQEGFLLKHKEAYLAIDLYLSDYVDRNCSQLVAWKRLYAPPVEPAQLDFLDVVLCTHGHYDHADPVTLQQIAQANPATRFVVPAPEKDTVAAYGIELDRIIPAIAYERLELAGFEIIPVPAAHETLQSDARGHYPALGYIIRVNGQTFFHGGDMCMYDGLVEYVKPFLVDVAFLPINGRDYFRNGKDIIGNLNCGEAVLLAKELGADLLVPMHHDLYAVNRVRTAHFVDAVEEWDPFRKYHIFAPGEGYITQRKEQAI